MERRRVLGMAVMFLLVGLMVCLLAGGAWAADGAVINKFMAAPDILSPGQTTTLFWKVINASHIEIYGLEKEPESLPLEGSLEVWPMTTTTYVLIAYGLDGKVISKAITVNVGLSGPVKIEYFNAAPMWVAPGDPVTLSWKVKDGVSTEILGISTSNECVGPTEGTQVVNPQITTTYVLQATGSNGEVTSASVTVNVSCQLPRILTFTADKRVISLGELVNLAWTTENAVRCTLSDGEHEINRAPNGTIAVTPNKSKIFTLTAYDAYGNEAKASVNIIVQ